MPMSEAHTPATNRISAPWVTAPYLVATAKAHEALQIDGGCAANGTPVTSSGRRTGQRCPRNQVCITGYTETHGQET